MGTNPETIKRARLRERTPSDVVPWAKTMIMVGYIMIIMMVIFFFVPVGVILLLDRWFD